MSYGFMNGYVDKSVCRQTYSRANKTMPTSIFLSIQQTGDKTKIVLLRTQTVTFRLQLKFKHK